MDIKCYSTVTYFLMFGFSIVFIRSATARILHVRKEALETLQNIWEMGNEFEGDILIPNYRRNIRKNETYRWPNNTVPYEFDTLYDEKQRQWVMYSLTEITNNSCVKFKLRSSGEKDYVFITNQTHGCSSYKGRIGGRQIMNLKQNQPGHGCFNLSVIVHEFMHVLGFIHQQSVYNRDEYIKINYQNIKAGKERDFQIYSRDKAISLGEGYDFQSIMHYSVYAKSKNGGKTIEPKVVVGYSKFQCGACKKRTTQQDRHKETE